MLVRIHKPRIASEISTAGAFDAMNAKITVAAMVNPKYISRKCLRKANLPIRLFSGFAWCDCECGGDGGVGLGGGLEGAGSV